MSDEEKKQNALVPLTSMNNAQLAATLDDRKEKLQIFRNKAISCLRTEHIMDHGGESNPYIQERGADAVIKMMGMKLFNFVNLPQITVDHGDGIPEIIFTMQCEAEIQGLGVSTYTGAASTRDKFLGIANGVPKPLNEISIPNIIKKAHTNLIGNVIRHQLNITWEDLEAVGIKREDCGKVSFRKKESAASTPETDEKREKIRGMVSEMYPNIKDQDEYCISVTNNVDKTGKSWPGKKLKDWSDLDIKYKSSRVEKDYNDFVAAVKKDMDNSDAGLFGGKK